MRKAIFALALGATMLFASNAMATAWCSGTEDAATGKVGACTAESPGADATGCSGDPTTLDGKGCLAGADGGDGCIGGSAGPDTGGAVGCVCLGGQCACSTGAPVEPVVPCDEATCRAAAEAGCS